MVLPENNIRVSQVRNILGEDTNKISELVLSPNVNPFGFNSPSSIQNNTFWGVTDRSGSTIGYPLGAFRRYDHEWIARMFGGVSVISDDPEDWTVLKITIPLASGILLDKPDVTTYHNFTVKVSKTNDFHQGGGITIADGITVGIDNDNPSFTVQFNADNIGAEGGDTFYCYVLHNSSDERRWYIPGASLGTANQGGDEYVTELQMPEDPYTYNVSIKEVTFSAIDDSLTGIKAVTGRVTVFSDTRTSGSVTVTIQYSGSDGFASSDTGTLTITVNYPAGRNQETTEIASEDVNWLSVGDTVYWRYRVNGGSWSSTRTTTVIIPEPL